MNDFIVTAEESGERLAALLARNGLTRSAAQRLIEAGFVTLRGYPVKKTHRTAPGELIEVRLPAPAPSALLPQEFPLDVVYEDGDVIVINKPRGMVVHPAPGHADGTLVNALLFHCGDSLSGIGGEKRPGIVHRLDKDTSGLIIAAKNDFAHLSLSRQLKNRSLTRIYEAVAHGGYREDAGKVYAPIGRDPADRKRMRVIAPSRAPAGAGKGARPERAGPPRPDALRRLPPPPRPGGRARRRDPLGGGCPIQRLDPCALPSGDGPHASDPGAYGVHRAPPAGRYGLRKPEAGKRPYGSVSPCRPDALSPSPYGKGTAAAGRTAGVFYRRSRAARSAGGRIGIDSCNAEREKEVKTCRCGGIMLSTGWRMRTRTSIPGRSRKRLPPPSEPFTV